MLPLATCKPEKSLPDRPPAVPRDQVDLKWFPGLTLARTAGWPGKRARLAGGIVQGCG